jgi:hypothetical protein
MKGIYQPEIIKQADEVLELLKEDVEITDRAREDLCIILTKKLLEGNLPEGPRVFDSEDELNGFIHLCNTRKSLEELQRQGYIDSFDDNESFFLTTKGTEYVEKNLLGR